MDIPTMLIMSSVKWKFTVRNDKKIGTLVNNALRFFEVYKKYIDIKKITNIFNVSVNPIYF